MQSKRQYNARRVTTTSRHISKLNAHAYNVQTHTHTHKTCMAGGLGQNTAMQSKRQCNARHVTKNKWAHIETQMCTNTRHKHTHTHTHIKTYIIKSNTDGHNHPAPAGDHFQPGKPSNVDRWTSDSDLCVFWFLTQTASIVPSASLVRDVG